MPVLNEVQNQTFGEEVTNAAQYVQEDDRIGVHYMAYNSYDHRQGVHLVGVTSPDGFKGQNCAFVQLTAPTNVWVFRWTSASFFGKPRIPDATPLNKDWVLLQRLPEIPMVTVGPDGETPLYRVTGTYVYGKKTPSTDPFDDASFPLPAFLEDSFDRATGNLQRANLADAASVSQTAHGAGGAVADVANIVGQMAPFFGK